MSVRPGFAFGLGVAFGAVVVGRFETGRGAAGFGLAGDVSDSDRVGDSDAEFAAAVLTCDSEAVPALGSAELFVSTDASATGDGIEASMLGAGAGDGDGSATTLHAA